MADKAYYSERFKALLFGQPVLYQLAVVMHPGVKVAAEVVQILAHDAPYQSRSDEVESDALPPGFRVEQLAVFPQKNGLINAGPQTEEKGNVNHG